MNMKKYILLTFSTAMLALSSCGDDTMDKINKDTQHPTSEIVAARLQLSEAIMSTAFRTVSGDYAYYTSSLTEQLIGSGNNQLMKAELRQSVELAASTTFNNVWGSTYSNIMNLNQMIDKVENDIASSGGQLDVLGVAQLLKAINVGFLTDMHGDIPYSEAFKGSENMQPALDSQESIYAAIMKLIEDAISNLSNSNGKNLGEQDILFHGNINSWLASAYAIKARYLIHQSKVNPAAVALAKEAANKAIDLGFNGMNLTEFNGVTCDNPWSAFIWSRHYTAPSTHVTSLMVGDDPRFDYYNGASAVDPGDEAAAKESAWKKYPEYYDLGSQPVHIMSYAELCFILAEAQLRGGDDATDAFRKGVASSINEQASWLGDDEADGAAYAATLPIPTLKEVFEQKYIALAVDGQPETYNDIRRMKAMGEDYIVLTNPFNSQSGINRWPEVLPYGNSSVLSNPNVAAAYGDGTYVYSTKAWLFK